MQRRLQVEGSMRILFVTIIIALLMTGGPQQLCAGGVQSASVFVWDAESGAWDRLPAANDFASLTTSESAGGACDKNEWLVPFTTGANVFAGGREVVKTAVPLTPGLIRKLADDSFQVPVFTKVAWRVRITVTNINQSGLDGAVVTDHFGGEYAVSDLQASQGTWAVEAVGKAQALHLEWRLGYLAPGAAAWLELTVATKPNPAGKQEFTSPGNYVMNSGATLKYSLNGRQCSSTSNTLKVQAVSQEGWQGPQAEFTRAAFGEAEFSPVIIGEARPAGELKCLEPVGFSEEFAPLTPAIKPRMQYGKQIGFEVPEDLRVQWRLTLTVNNTLDRTITNVRVRENLGAELEIDPATVKVNPGLPGQVPSGAPSSTLSLARAGNIKIDWLIDRIDPGSQAVLSMVVFTGLTPSGKQQYVGCTQECRPNYLNSGANLKYLDRGRQYSQEMPAIPVWVACGGFLRVSLSATRYDWQVRKPGRYIADPLVIMIYSNRQVSVAFSGFADPVIQPTGGGAIPISYAFDDPRSGDAVVEWIRAVDLNNRRIITAKDEAGSGATLKMWMRLSVEGRTKAGEYEDSGTVTFSVLENLTYVSGEFKVPAIEEVRWTRASI